jgi:hypothetical protein
MAEEHEIYKSVGVRVTNLRALLGERIYAVAKYRFGRHERGAPEPYPSPAVVWSWDSLTRLVCAQHLECSRQSSGLSDH